MARPDQPISVTLLVPLFRLSAVMSQYAENGFEDLKVQIGIMRDLMQGWTVVKQKLLVNVPHNACVPHFHILYYHSLKDYKDENILIQSHSKFPTP
jgi:hypothetical protein